MLSHTGAAQGFFAHVLIVPERAAAMVTLTNGARGSVVAERAYRWFIERGLGLTVDVPKMVDPPPDPTVFDGTYRAVSRAVRLRSPVAGELVAEVDEAGPTWEGTGAAEMRFAEGNRLVGAHDPTLRMELGTFRGGRRWLRYRGRVHPRDS